MLPSDPDDSSSEEEEDNTKTAKPLGKKPGPAVQHKDLAQLGFTGGPSILYVPEPASTDEQSWDW